MSNVLDYPITELFGCQTGYPLNTNLCPPGQGYHNGIDYGCPTGTPIVVNGVTIGISGATGEVTGPHCHVGRWVNGVATNPGVGAGFTFRSAVVTEINEDAVNGKYVRVQGDGASWVYLHMSDNSKVTVGQVLRGVPVDNMSEAEYDALARRILTLGMFMTVDGNAADRQPTTQEVTDTINGLKSNPVSYIDYLTNTSPWQAAWNKVKHYNGDVAAAAATGNNVVPYTGEQLFVKKK